MRFLEKNTNSSTQSDLVVDDSENFKDPMLTNSSLSIDYQDNPQEIAKTGNTIQNNNAKSSFSIKRTSAATTLANAIQRAGGITSQTDLSKIEIIRDVPLGKGGGKKRAIIDFNSYVEESDPTNEDPELIKEIYDLQDRLQPYLKKVE